MGLTIAFILSCTIKILSDKNLNSGKLGVGLSDDKEFLAIITIIMLYGGSFFQAETLVTCDLPGRGIARLSQ